MPQHYSDPRRESVAYAKARLWNAVNDPTLRAAAREYLRAVLTGDPVDAANEARWMADMLGFWADEALADAREGMESDNE